MQWLNDEGDLGLRRLIIRDPVDDTYRYEFFLFGTEWSVNDQHHQHRIRIEGPSDVSRILKVLSQAFFSKALNPSKS